MREIGYEFLASSLKTAVFEMPRPARIAPVTRITQRADSVLVPQQVAPASDDPVEHLFFAFKHEGVQLQAAIAALKRIAPDAVAQAFLHTPSSRYARLACYLWEQAHGQALEGLPAATGVYEKVFDEAAYLTDRTQRNQRWRIDFNGIGSPAYCITVRRTPEIAECLSQDLLGQVAAFVDGLDQGVLDRAVRWAYLSETDNSYAIEKERPSASKAQAFADLLSQAHDRQHITEDYLVALQNLAVTNPMDQAQAFRSQQNRLRNDLRGAVGVTYLPPPPTMIDALMSHIMALANDANSQLDPLVRGSLISFAFVFAHPFMDGNGRLSRFLFHKIACADKRLKSGLVLPVSIAMKRNEQQYLAALQSFSKPSRKLWDVRWISDDDIDQQFLGDGAIYRYWDATDCVAFGLRMAGEALQKDLRQEMDFLHRYDAVYRAVNDAVDMNNHDLVLLVRSVAEHGSLSNHRRKQLIAKGHPVSLIDTAAEVAAEAWAASRDTLSGS